MGVRLASYVHVRSPQGETVVLGPDSELPDWAASAIDNPKAWEGGVHPGVPEPSQPEPSGTGQSAPDQAETTDPPQSTGGPDGQSVPAPEQPGGNASRDEWEAYARAVGAVDSDLVDEKGEPLGRNELRDKFGK